MQNPTIAFIGAGNMGSSLIGGLIADGYPAHKIHASSPHQDKLIALQQRYPVHITTDNLEAIQQADIVVLAVKPQIAKTVVSPLANMLQRNKSLVISVMAGISEDSLSHWLGANTAIVRCMPNTPAVLRCGATALHANPHVTAEQKQWAEKILQAVGITVWLEEEKLLNAVTALSGSGPAYFFRIMEIMQQTAIELGLPADTARLLTLQTCLGAAQMALASTEDTATLRCRVTSPAGTTESALQVLDQQQIDKIFQQALTAACERAEQLAQQFK